MVEKKEKKIQINLNGKSIEVGKDAVSSSPSSPKEELIKQIKRAASEKIFVPKPQAQPLKDNG
jgi:hypothetical protein